MMKGWFMDQREVHRRIMHKQLGKKKGKRTCNRVHPQVEQELFIWYAAHPEYWLHSAEGWNDRAEKDERICVKAKELKIKCKLISCISKMKR